MASGDSSPPFRVAPGISVAGRAVDAASFASDAAVAGDEAGDHDVASLIQLMLELEQIDVYIFRGMKLWKPMLARGAFGGHVVGQALVACVRTIPPGKTVNSFHSYFLLPADPDVPIIYTVKVLRDGKSFASRSCTATQGGKSIFSCMASFHSPEASEYRHQIPMPHAPPPESLPDSDARTRALLADERVPEFYKKRLARGLGRQGPIDLRYVHPVDDVEPQAAPGHQLVWLRANGTITDLATAAVHQCVAAYASDLALLGTSLRPTGRSRKDVAMMASLDHSLWFHAPFRADEWLLYELESTRLAGNRGFTSGRLFTQDGVLVASVAQEGVIRMAAPGDSDSLQPVPPAAHRGSPADVPHSLPPGMPKAKL